MKDETIMMLYIDAIKNGENVSKDMKSEKTDIEDLTEYDRVSLHSYQFSEYWLTKHKMKDISFMRSQFSWLSSGSGVLVYDAYVIFLD